MLCREGHNKFQDPFRIFCFVIFSREYVLHDPVPSETDFPSVLWRSIPCRIPSFDPSFAGSRKLLGALPTWLSWISFPLSSPFSLYSLSPSLRWEETIDWRIPWPYFPTKIGVFCLSAAPCCICNVSASISIWYSCLELSFGFALLMWRIGVSLFLIL